MPYKDIADLPDSVREHLPKHAQEIYLAAFNNAWQEYSDPHSRHTGSTREATEHRVAWAAVKKTYSKQADGRWRKEV
jgi:cation transport regulator